MLLRKSFFPREGIRVIDKRRKTMFMEKFEPELLSFKIAKWHVCIIHKIAELLKLE